VVLSDSHVVVHSLVHESQVLVIVHLVGISLISHVNVLLMLEQLVTGCPHGSHLLLRIVVPAHFREQSQKVVIVYHFIK
jgi:hypothetical protein